ALVAARVRSGLVPEAGGSNWWKKALLRHAVVIEGDRGSEHVVTEKMRLLAPWLVTLPAPRIVPPAAAALPPTVQSQLGPAPVFGPTNPQRWAPWPASARGEVRFARSIPIQHVGNVTLIQGSQACVPCGRAGCADHNDSRSDCLQSITAAPVLQEALRRLTSSAEPLRATP